jgi:5'-deoxynucleotidase YfbR-like HD superfamily hydrolase
MRRPKVFISYSWDSEEHKMWVIALTNELRISGIDALIDEFITQKGTVNLNGMMVENIRDKDYILVILTENYAAKAEALAGGVGYETTLIYNVMKNNPEKIIPILRSSGNSNNAIPFYLKGYTYIDFSHDAEFNSKFEDLILKIRKIDKFEIEKLGELKEIKSKKVTMDSIIERAPIISDTIIPESFKKINNEKHRNKKIEDVKINDFNEFIQYIEDQHLDRRLKASINELGIDIALERYSILFSKICELPECFISCIGNSLFKNIAEKISSNRSEIPLLINGNIGSGKSTFLSILYYALKKYSNSHYVVYINLHSYEHMDNIKTAQQKFREDTQIINRFLQDKSFPLVLLIDGLNDFYRKIQETSKNWLDNMFKEINGMNKRIVAIGTWDDCTSIDKVKTIMGGIQPQNIIYLKKFTTSKSLLELFVQTQVSEYQEARELTNQLKTYIDDWQLPATDFRFLCMLMDGKDDINRLSCFSDFLKAYCMDKLKQEQALISISKQAFMTIRPSDTKNIMKDKQLGLLSRHIYILEFLVGYCLYHELLKGLNDQDGNILKSTIIFSENTNKISKELLSSISEKDSQIIFHNMSYWLTNKEDITIEMRMQICYLVSRVFGKKIARKEIINLLISQWDFSTDASNSSSDTFLLQRTIACSLAILDSNQQLHLFIDNVLSNDLYRDVNLRFYCNYYAYSNNSNSLSEILDKEISPNKVDETLSRLYGNIKRAINSRKYDTYDLIVLDIATYFSLIQSRYTVENPFDNYEENMIEAKRLLKDLFEHKESTEIIAKIESLKQYLYMLDCYWDIKTPIGILEEVYQLKRFKRAGWKNRGYHYGESISDHICGLYYLGLFLLPKDPPLYYGEIYKRYDKEAILKTIMLHDLGESRYGDIASNKKNDEERHNEQKLAFAILSCGAYTDLANLQDRKRLLIDFYEKNTINGKIAYELDKIENLIQIYIYEKDGIKFEDSEEWKRSLRERIKTNLGIDICKKIDSYFSE